MDEKLRFIVDLQNKASAELRKLQRDMGGVKQTPGMTSAGNWFRQLETASAASTKAIRPLAGGLNAIGVGGLAAGLSIAGLVGQFRDLARSLPALQELSRQSGISKTEILRLQYAASKLHVDPSKMTGAIDTWSAKMVAFQKESGEIYFQMQNGSAGLAEKMRKEYPTDPAAALKDQLKWLAAIPAEAERAGKSVQEAAQLQKYWVGRTLGDEGLEQFFGKGIEGVTAALDEAAQRVHPVTEDLAKAASNFDDSILNFSTTWSNFENDVGPVFLNPLSAALDKLDGALNLAAKYPDEAATAAGVIAGGLAALRIRNRLMRGSALGGGRSSAALGRAAGEMTGAAEVQKTASTTFAEAVTEFRAAAEMRGKGGGGPGGASPSEEKPAKPGEPTKPGEPVKPGEPEGRSPGYGNLGFRSFLFGMQSWQLAADMPDPATPEGQARISDSQNAVDSMDKRAADATGGFFAQPGQEDTIRPWVKNGFSEIMGALGALNPVTPAHSEEAPPSGSPAFTPNAWTSPSAYNREARARGLAFRSQVTDTDGNALHRHDDELSPVTAQELFQKVREGSKEGIVAGFRQMVQEQDLAGGGGASGVGIGQDGGAPSLRYGRGAGGGYRSAPGTAGGAPLGQGAQGGAFKGGRTPQAALAKESYDFWRGKGLDHNAALSMVAQEQGESGFNFRQKSGDSGLAHGAFSWHPDRRAAIQRGTGIDIDSADHKQQLEAAFYEGTKGERAGFLQSLNGRTLQDAVYQGVHRFEGSKYQMADTAKRLGMARAWDGGGSFLAPKPAEGAAPAPSSAAAGPRGAFPDWMDDKSKREMAGINSPLARDLIAASEATGTHFRILQGLRTQNEANANALSGRGVRNSQHLWGAAADLKLTDASGHDLDRMDPAYGRFADAYEAHSKATGGHGRWLGHAGGGWSWDRAHFDQGIGYGQSHARDPYGTGGPTADDVAKGNKEIFSSPDNPFLKAAKPLGDAAEKLKKAVGPLPTVTPEPPVNANARAAQIDPVRIDLHHHEGRTRIATKTGKGVQLSIKTAPTMVQTG